MFGKIKDNDKRKELHVNIIIWMNLINILVREDGNIKILRTQDKII